ncbi:MAG: PD-(D/E)XK nuclease-like domain-containing protein [Acidiferrobacterales bacterium]|nr:PD-(D/E)XK nuclease-like domain-containing protein [Acidiferrobacterales bacterium]
MIALPPNDLSNAAYQWLYHASGSFLHTIYKKSPAHAKHAQAKESEALSIGIAAHAMLLEPESFEKDFERDFDASVYENIMVTANDLKAWLKEAGMKTSGSKAELIDRILTADNTVHIADVLQKEHEEKHEGKTLIKPETFDDITAMRQVILKDDEMAAMIENGFAEYSLLTTIDGVACKSRPDLITSAGGIIQYKTTTDCHPNEFGKKAHDYGYFLKAALEWRSFKAVYGANPKYYVFLVQEKTFPYIWKPSYIDLNSDAMIIGMAQLDLALRLCKQSVETNRWQAYGTNIEEVQLPEYLKRQYGLGA